MCVLKLSEDFDVCNKIKLVLVCKKPLMHSGLDAKFMIRFHAPVGSEITLFSIVSFPYLTTCLYENFLVAVAIPFRRGRNRWMVRVGIECRCVRRAEIEEIPDYGKSGPSALPMFCQ